MFSRVSNFDSEMVSVGDDTGIVLAVSTAVVSPELPESADRATHVVISVTGGDVLVTTDGSDPDLSGRGRLYVADGAPFVMAQRAFRRSSWLRAGGTDGNVYAEPVVSNN